MTFAVEVKDVSLNYHEVAALKNISFTLEKGKIYGLLGRNGAGKTSLLSLLASLREQTGGTIRILGDAPFENPEVMQDVVFIYEKDNKDESEKVIGMLKFAERYRPHFNMDYAMDLVKGFNLPLNKAVKKLSKGQQSALFVTIGLASRCPLTIFDEAYLGMDAPTREIFYKELLEDQSNHPRTIIISTHLVSEMDYLFDEVLIIDKGTLILQEENETLISRGATITGTANEVDQFVKGLRKLNEQQLGNTKRVVIYGALSKEQRNEAKEKGLEVGVISLQDLFIHLTGEGM
ncbi:MAG TPA: ABC transporter [Paenibacillaceae bacterium]|nr:ABC transporter [Paenibacillaceae bacterium]